MLLPKPLQPALAGLPRRVVGRLLRLPAPVLAQLAGGAPQAIDGAPLEPDIHFLVSSLNRAPVPALGESSLREQRRASRIMWPLLSPWAQVAASHDARVPGPDGYEVPIRIYTPHRLQRPAPAFVYMHGGGFVLGDLDTHDGVCRHTAAEVGCVVIAIDYRLAPEHPFPAAVNDCLAAVDWVFRSAADLGIVPTRIAVGGDSAGGNLSAVVCQQRKAAGAPLPCLQLLTYPMTDAKPRARSHELFAEGYILTAEAIAWFLDSYLEHSQDYDDPRASPLLQGDLTGLPPAYVATAGFDPLRDEGQAYAQRLRAAGNQVTYVCHPGLIHGYVQMAGASPSSKRAVQGQLRALEAGLRP